MFLVVSGIMLGAFFLNVFLGASGGGLNLSEVTEMLILVTATVFFVVGILTREAASEEAKNEDHQ